MVATMSIWVFSQSLSTLPAEAASKTTTCQKARVPAAAPAVRPAAPAAAAAPSAEQQQACSTFASKLSAAAASSAAQAQQVYAMGTQKLTGMFGPNPCPAVKAPI
jgi:hypothetical protein